MSTRMHELWSYTRIFYESQNSFKSLRALEMQVDVVANVSDVDSLRLGFISVWIEHVQSIKRHIASLSKAVALAIEEVLYAIEYLYRLGVRCSG
jgi:hypothetical protein